MSPITITKNTVLIGSAVLGVAATGTLGAALLTIKIKSCQAAKKARMAVRLLPSPQ